MSSDDDLSARISARVAELTATRSWPWMQPGALSVGMDEYGRIVEYRAQEDSLVSIRVLVEADGTHAKPHQQTGTGAGQPRSD